MKTKDRNLLIAGATGVAVATIASFTIASILKKDHPPLDVVPEVDLRKYAGEWFEIARLPVRYEKHCHKSKANYTLADDGTLDIVNSCHMHSSDGKLRKAKGRAFVKDPDDPARFRVQFLWPFRGDYQIIALGSDYEYAMVGTPDRKNLWILSRTPELNITVMKDLLDKASAQGFDTSQLVFTPQ